MTASLGSHDSYIQDVTFFMYDTNVLYGIDEEKLLLGIMSRRSSEGLHSILISIVHL